MLTSALIAVKYKLNIRTYIFNKQYRWIL
jgi:hypothetical protein